MAIVPESARDRNPKTLDASTSPNTLPSRDRSSCCSRSASTVRDRSTSAAELAEAARSQQPDHRGGGVEGGAHHDHPRSAGGVVTGVGGFSALPVALPVNVVEFYVQAARMVSAIAILRGHDVDDPQVRKAVLQTLVGTQHDSALVEAVTGTRGGALTWRVLRFLPSGVLLLASKGIGFRLLRAITELLFGRFGRGVPFLGGVVVGAVDGWNMRRIAAHAKVAFPAKAPRPRGPAPSPRAAPE